MKLGVDGLLPEWSSIQYQTARRVRDAGFLGATMRFNRPLETDLEQVRRLKTILDRAGLRAAQVNGWYEVLVHPDSERRAAGVRGLQRLVQFGTILAAETVYVRPGSMHPEGGWQPHPDNHKPETLARLADSLRAACETAAAEGIPLAIEGHVLSPLDTPARTAELIGAVASPWLKFNTDPANFIGSVRAAHDTRPTLEDLHRRLGPVTAAGHAKDVRLGPEMVLSIRECLLGTGTLDYGMFLRHFAQDCPDGFLLIEHLPDEQVAQARANLLRLADDAGITFEY